MRPFALALLVLAGCAQSVCPPPMDAPLDVPVDAPDVGDARGCRTGRGELYLQGFSCGSFNVHVFDDDRRRITTVINSPCVAGRFHHIGSFPVGHYLIAVQNDHVIAGNIVRGIELIDPARCAAATGAPWGDAGLCAPLEVDVRPCGVTVAGL